MFSHSASLNGRHRGPSQLAAGGLSQRRSTGTCRLCRSRSIQNTKNSISAASLTLGAEGCSGARVSRMHADTQLPRVAAAAGFGVSPARSRACTAVRSMGPGKTTKPYEVDPDVERVQRGEITPDVEKRLEAASKIISEMMVEVSKEVFVKNPSNRLPSKKADEVEEEAITTAIQKRLHTFDELFLIALSAFSKIAAEQGDPNAKLLEKIRVALIGTIQERLPIEVQLLDQLVVIPESEKRVEIIWGVLEKKRAPFVDPYKLDSAAVQFIEDMENKAEIVDRRLLARMLLVREELQMAARESALKQGREYVSPDDKIADHRKSVQVRAVAFLQAVMKVPDRRGRAAYLRKAFTSDWEGAAPVRAPAGSVSESGDEKSDSVRPGRFLTAVHVMQREMNKPGQDIKPVILERIEDIRRECFEILTDIAKPDPVQKKSEKQTTPSSYGMPS